MSESLPLDSSDDELKQALAAFGEDAMELLLDDDDLSEDLMECAVEDEQLAAVEEPQPETSQSDALDIREIGINDQDSSLIRYTKELANAIYCGHSMPHQQKRNEGGSSTTDRCIVFTVGQQPFALPLSTVREILRRPLVTRLPHTPAWLRGVTNMRGQIISVIDLHYLVGIPTSVSSATEKAIVIHSEETNQSTSIVADRILGIRNLRDQQFDLSNLSVEFQSIANAVAAFDAGEVVVIDNGKLFEAASLTTVSNQANQHLTI